MNTRMSKVSLLSPMRLGVNVDHVATLRQARGTIYPDPVEAGRIALAAGASSITVHLREDRRHIQDRDVAASKRVRNEDRGGLRRRWAAASGTEDCSCIAVSSLLSVGPTSAKAR